MFSREAGLQITGFSIKDRRLLSQSRKLEESGCVSLETGKVFTDYSSEPDHNQVLNYTYTPFSMSNERGQDPRHQKPHLHLISFVEPDQSLKVDVEPPEAVFHAANDEQGKPFVYKISPPATVTVTTEGLSVHKTVIKIK